MIRVGRYNMALKIKCDICNNELNKAGALLFTPPVHKSDVDKYHICVKCWPKVRQLLIVLSKKV